ncbi:hypothetical protein V1509DRAFT_628181 [Lipomyces kononenkoae]
MIVSLLNMRVMGRICSMSRHAIIPINDGRIMISNGSRTLSSSCHLQSRKRDDPEDSTINSTGWDSLGSEIDFIKPPDRRGRWNLPMPTYDPPGASRTSNAKLDLPSNWRKAPNLPKWKKHRLAVKEKIGGAQWDPRKKLSPEARIALRQFKEEYPEIKSSEIAKFFGISGESVRRILKSKWQPLTEEEYRRFNTRWENRRERILDTWVKIGRIPPRRKKEDLEPQELGNEKERGNSKDDP